MPREYYPPFFVIPISLDRYGKMTSDPKQAVTTIYEVWDGANQTLHTFENEIEAKQTADNLNEMTRDFAPYGSFRSACQQFRLAVHNFITTVMNHARIP